MRRSDPVDVAIRAQLEGAIRVDGDRSASLACGCDRHLGLERCGQGVTRVMSSAEDNNPADADEKIFIFHAVVGRLPAVGGFLWKNRDGDHLVFRRHRPVGQDVRKRDRAVEVGAGV